VIEADGFDPNAYVQPVWDGAPAVSGLRIHLNDTVYPSGSIPGASFQRFPAPHLRSYPSSTPYHLAWRDGQFIFYKEVLIDSNVPHIVIFPDGAGQSAGAAGTDGRLKAAPLRSR